MFVGVAAWKKSGHCFQIGHCVPVGSEVVLTLEMSWKPRVHDVRSPPELLDLALHTWTFDGLKKAFAEGLGSREDMQRVA